MSDKKVEFSEMAKSISTLVSAVAKSIQNGLGSFEKSSGFEDFFKDIYGDKTIEIEKIKFILKEVIKLKREKMVKKSSAKKIKEEVKNFEKNKVKDLGIKEEKIFVQDINLKELSKYEKIKKFRDLRNINIIYSDKKDKLKKFQEIYTLINSKIREQDKKWIFSKKDNIYYVLSYKIFTTERFSGKYDIFSLKKRKMKNITLIKLKKFQIELERKDLNLIFLMKKV